MVGNPKCWGGTARQWKWVSSRRRKGVQARAFIPNFVRPDFSKETRQLDFYVKFPQILDWMYLIFNLIIHWYTCSFKVHVHHLNWLAILCHFLAEINFCSQGIDVHESLQRIFPGYKYRETDVWIDTFINWKFTEILRT